jgi:phosphatidylglycerophosphate synthase
MFDGHVARMTGRVSRSGAFFDSVMDRFCEGVVLLGLAAYYRDSWVLYVVVLALIGSMMVSYTRARGEGVGVEVKEGFMQRPERIVYLGVGSVFSPLFSYFVFPFLAVPVYFLNAGAIVLIAIMTNITAVQRMLLVMKRLES